VCAYVVCYRPELPEQLGGIINNGCILEDGAVVLKIDCGRLGCILSLEALSFPVSFTERLEGRNCFCGRN
jgi:hypothetical protein